MLQRSAISFCKSISRRHCSCFTSRTLSTSVFSTPKHIMMKTHHFLLRPTSSSNYATTQFKILGNTQRHYSSSSVDDTSKVVDEINLKFAEARDEIESALESKETVYFNEEAECARDAVKEVLDMYDGLLAKLSEKERGVIQRSMGLKIEQLKAELQQLNE